MEEFWESVIDLSLASASSAPPGDMTIRLPIMPSRLCSLTSERGTLSTACVQQSTRHRYRCAIWQKWRAASDAIPQLAAALLTEPQQERRPREDHLLDKNYCALAAKEQSHCVNSSLSLAA